MKSIPLPSNLKPKYGRRNSSRYLEKFQIDLLWKTPDGEYSKASGNTLTFHEEGLSCEITNGAIPKLYQLIEISPSFSSEKTTQTGVVGWINKNKIGIRIPASDIWKNLIQKLINSNNIQRYQDRRGLQRRLTVKSIGFNLRKDSERRFIELIKEASVHSEIPKTKRIKGLSTNRKWNYTKNDLGEVQGFIESRYNLKLKHIPCYSEPIAEFHGKIENPMGVCHTPLGLAGPLKINGEYAQGEFYIPLATTEGALVTSYNLGSHIVSRSGGANVKILKNELKIGPIFVFKSLRESLIFDKWLNNNFNKIKEIAENTSSHLTLLKITTIIDGRKVNVNFHYDTGDAMGMNMACQATNEVCKMISRSVHPEEFWLRSNFNSNKKVTGNGLINGYGRTVTSDVTIPKKLVNLLNTTPENMQRYVYRTLLSDSHALMIGANGHFANAITAIFIACGQDVALVTNSHIGISTCEVTNSGDLYFSVYLSSLLVGTVGGGTGFGTSKECLEILDCYGTGKSNKFAEIIAATALAGEISICASITNGTYAYAHETLGRNRPDLIDISKI